MGNTKIEWTQSDDGTPGKTWNPIRGCSRVSEGCRNCYAERVAARFSGPGMPYEGLARRTASGEARWTGEVKLVLSALHAPLRWQRPRRIFVNSMSDLFHEKLHVRDIDMIFAVMLLAPHHTFQVLTKRAARMRDYFLGPDLYSRILAAADKIRVQWPKVSQIGISDPARMPAPHIWLGVSVEDQDAANERIPHLLATPAAVRFLSCEPLLGPIELPRDAFITWRVVSTGVVPEAEAMGPRPSYRSITWVITGGESGPDARPMHPDWARSLRDQCAQQGVSFFHKQNGEYVEGTAGQMRQDNAILLRTHDEVGRLAVMVRVGKKAAGSLLDGIEHKAFPKGDLS